jgi:hypothetical protein
MMLAPYEVQVAFSMKALAEQSRANFEHPIAEFMCYWVAFNNVYVTIADRHGDRASLRQKSDGSVNWISVGPLRMARVDAISERRQLETAFKYFPEDLKSALVSHDNVRFFVERSPKWQGQILEYDALGQRLNGVINVGHTVDARHPVWAPIDASLYSAYTGLDSTIRDLLAKQILDLLYTIRNNVFHGGKRADDADEVEVVERASPLLALILDSLVTFPKAA